MTAVQTKAKRKSAKVMEVETHSDRDKDRLTLHIGPKLRERVLEAAQAHSAAAAGVAVTQVDVARIAIDRGVIMTGGVPTLRRPDSSMLQAEEEPEGYSERIFVPRAAKAKADIAAIAKALSATGVTKIHPQEAARAILRSGLIIVDGKAVLRKAP